MPTSCSSTPYQHRHDEADQDGEVTLSIPEEHFFPWSPDTPFLYDLTVGTTQGEEAGFDTVHSYFALRKWSCAPDAHGVLRFCLNDKPILLNGLLDQGYWPEGLYTPPSDAAVERELSEVKALGFNLLRKHLTMNQESLAECLYQRKWFNPFPKFKFTERPDVAAAQVLEGDIVILVDNSPSAMIIPTSIFDIIDEADDYYFPPVTGTYLRLTRFIIAILTYVVTPTFLLLMQNPEWVPESFQFIMLKDPSNIPLVAQFLILELAIDGLKLAAVNTPNMLSTPLSVMAALVLGEFSVNSGWFNSEVMLYMAFVALANYTQQNYELGYALKFMRIINLILTALFGVWGYIGAIVFFILSIVNNKTLSDKSYIYPLLPFNFRQLAKRLFRLRLPEAKK